MNLKDRTTQGFIAGAIGEFSEMVFTLTLFYIFHLIKFRYMDFASTIVFNKLPKGLFECIISEILVYIFTGLLGVIFSLLTKTVSSRNLLMKGGIFGIVCWFLIYALVTFFKVKPLFPTDFTTSLVHMIGGLIWGISMALVYLKLVEKYGVTS